MFSLPVQPGCHLSIQEPIIEVPYSKFSDHIIPLFKKYYIPQKPPKSQKQPQCPTHCAGRTSNITFTGQIGQRHLNIICDGCPPRLDGEMLQLRSGIQPKQLNMKIIIAMFSWHSLAIVLMNNFLWTVSATWVVYNRNESQTETT